MIGNNGYYQIYWVSILRSSYVSWGFEVGSISYMSNRTRGRLLFYKFKKFILTLSAIYRILPIKIRIKLFEHYRMTKGIKGLVIRYALLKTIAGNCGDNVSIHPGVFLLSPDKLIVGNNVSIHPMCYIDSTGGVVIGNNVSIAHGATIMSTTHHFKNLNLPIKDQEIELIKTIINDDVWIGAKATILAGKTISSGTVIAANSVVTKDTKKNTVVGGIPAAVLKGRDENFSDN